jgi:hypothetical protein
LLRTQSYAESAIAATRDQQRLLDVQSIEWSVHSLELYRDIMLGAQSSAAAHDIGKVKRGLDFLVIASEVLLSAHERLLQPTPDEREALVELRKLCRETASRLMKETKHYPEALKPIEGESEFAKDGTEPNTGNIHFVRSVYGSTWYDDPSQAFDVYRDLLESRDEFDRNLRVQLSLLFVRPGMHSPKIIDWSSRGPLRIEALWNKLIEELCDSTNSEQQVLGHSIRLARMSPLLRQPRGPEPIKIAIEQLVQALWNHREAIARRQVDERVPADAIDIMEDILSTARGYGVQGILGDGVVSLRKRLYAYLLPQREHYSNWLWGSVFRASDYSPEEARQCYELIETYRRNAPDAEKLAWHQSVLREVFERRPGRPSRAAIPGSLSVRRFWASPAEEIDSVIRSDDRLWVLGHSFDYPKNGHHVIISAIDPDTLRTETRELTWPGWWPQDATFAVISNRVFVSADTNIWSTTWKQSDWQKLDLPKEIRGRILAVDDWLYVCPRSAIYRFRPADSSVELLASARRRPALTPLDDFPPFNVEKIFRTSDGALCIEIAGQWYFRYEERTARWTRLGANSDAIYNHKIDRDLLLSAIGVDQYNPHDESFGSVYLLLLDVNKNGQPQEVPHTWPPHIALDGVARSHVFGAVVQGQDLWVLFHSSVHGTCVRYCPASGNHDVVIPLSLEADPSQSTGQGSPQERFSPLCATPRHLVICGTNGLWFVPMNELQDYIKQRLLEARE